MLHSQLKWSCTPSPYLWMHTVDNTSELSFHEDFAIEKQTIAYSWQFYAKQTHESSRENIVFLSRWIIYCLKIENSTLPKLQHSMLLMTLNSRWVKSWVKIAGFSLKRSHNRVMMWINKGEAFSLGIQKHTPHLYFMHCAVCMHILISLVLLFNLQASILYILENFSLIKNYFLKRYVSLEFTAATPIQWKWMEFRLWRSYWKITFNKFYSNTSFHK